MTDRELALLCAAEDVLARWAIVRVSDGKLGACRRRCSTCTGARWVTTPARRWLGLWSRCGE